MLLTEKELSAKLRVSRDTLINYRKMGMPFLRIGSRTIRYEWDKVYQWLYSVSNSVSEIKE